CTCLLDFKICSLGLQLSYQMTDLNVTFLNVTFYQLMQVAMFLHVQILQGSVIATDGTPISSGHYVLQGARPALRWSAAIGGLGGGALWDEDTFVISLEEGHYAAYIKMMALKYMTDEDVAVEALILSDVTDLYLFCLFCLANMNVSAVILDVCGIHNCHFSFILFFSFILIHLCNFIMYTFHDYIFAV
ncbi:hypothetical protein ACJX0J_020725, partial [Zea mays]